MGFSLFVRVPAALTAEQRRRFTGALLRELPELLSAQMPLQLASEVIIDGQGSWPREMHKANSVRDEWCTPTRSDPLRRALLTRPRASTTGVLITCAPGPLVEHLWSFVLQHAGSGVIVAARMVAGFNDADGYIAVRFLSIVQSVVHGASQILSELNPLENAAAAEECRRNSLQGQRRLSGVTCRARCSRVTAPFHTTCPRPRGC